MSDRVVRPVVCALVLSAAMAGCETKAGTGAVAGGGGGALIGGIIGHQSGNTAGGAIIGGAVGAIGGALVGNEMDKNDAKEKRQAYDRSYETQTDTTARSSMVAEPVSKTEVMNWTARGIKDDIIVDRIERSGTVFHLTAADEREMRDAGVAPAVIATMRDTGRVR